MNKNKQIISTGLLISFSIWIMPLSALGEAAQLEQIVTNVPQEECLCSGAANAFDEDSKSKMIIQSGCRIKPSRDITGAPTQEYLIPFEARAISFLSYRHSDSAIPFYDQMIVSSLDHVPKK